MYRLENNIIEVDDGPIEKKYVGGLGYFCINFMKKHGEKIAQVDLSTNKEDTFNDLLRKCIRTAIVLRNMGIQKGDIVTICSETNSNSYVPSIACFLIGAIPSYIDVTHSLFDIVHLVKITETKLFLVTPNFVDTVKNLVKNHKNANVTTFTDDFFTPSVEEGEFKPIFIEDLQETALIHFSSGSTGLPKGICINHYSLMYSKILSCEKIWTVVGRKVILSFDSLHWCVDSVRLMCSIKNGVCRLVGSDETVIKNVWFILDKYKVNVAFLIPFTLIHMVETGKPENIDLRNLTTIFVEGSNLPVKYHQALQELLPNVDVFGWYGQTEAGEITTFQKTDLHRKYNITKPGCLGTPALGFEMALKVVDLESREALGPYKRGELLVKSKSSMNGYYNLDSSDQYDENGWLKTGDIVYYDEDFCFFIVDRIKDVILFQGWHIIPALLEAQLLRHPAVKLAAVIGIPDGVSTEHPVGLVALHDNVGTVTPEEIEKYVEGRVPDKYRLRGGVKIVQEACLKSANKIKRFKLKQLVVSGEI